MINYLPMEYQDLINTILLVITVIYFMSQNIRHYIISKKRIETIKNINKPKQRKTQHKWLW